MLRAPTLRTRAAAAVSLVKRKHPGAVPAMINDWKKFVLDDARYRDQDPFERERSAKTLISFLAECDDPSAINALAEGLSRHNVGRRLAIIAALGSSDSFSMFGIGLNGTLNPGIVRKPPSKAVRQAIEDLLVAALKDTEEAEDVSGT